MLIRLSEIVVLSRNVFFFEKCQISAVASFGPRFAALLAHSVINGNRKAPHRVNAWMRCQWECKWLFRLGSSSLPSLTVWLLTPFLTFCPGGRHGWRGNCHQEHHQRRTMFLYSSVPIKIFLGCKYLNLLTGYRSVSAKKKLDFWRDHLTIRDLTFRVHDQKTRSLNNTLALL